MQGLLYGFIVTLIQLVRRRKRLGKVKVLCNPHHVAKAGSWSLMGKGDANGALDRARVKDGGYPVPPWMAVAVIVH